MCEAKGVQDISVWKTDSLLSTEYMFGRCTRFNQDLSSWNMENVNNMDYMYQGCSSLDTDLKLMNISKYASGTGLFANSTMNISH